MKTTPTIFILAICLLILGSSLTSKAAQGDVDMSFTGSLYDTPQGRNSDVDVRKIAVQSDGKIIIAGGFTVIAGKTKKRITRLNADGTIDSTFNPPVFSTENALALLFQHLSIQSDGKILVGGTFKSANGLNKPGIVRLNADGSLDNTFDLLTGTGSSFLGSVSDVEVLGDGKLILVGGFTYRPDNVQPALTGLVKLNPNGTVDNSYNHSNIATGYSNIEVQSDGKLVVIASINNSPNLLRFNPNGGLDNSFNISVFNNDVYALELQSDGRIVVGGSFRTVNSFALQHLGRFNSDGTVDANFNGSGIGPSATVTSIRILANDKILIGGLFTTYNASAKKAVAVLNANGNEDVTFNSTLNFNNLFDVAVDLNGRILAGTYGVYPIIPNNFTNISALTRLNTNGSLDTTFNPEIGAGGRGFKVKAMSDGKIYVGGRFIKASGKTSNSLVRFNSDGTPDLTFNQNVFVYTSEIFAFDILADGKIVAASANNFTVYFLNPNGTLITSFSANAFIREIKTLPSGKVLIAGQGYIKVFNPNGTVDNTFNQTVDNFIYRSVVQPDGKIIICGEFISVGGFNRGRIARLNTDGSVDTTFNPVTGANGSIYDLALQSDGKVIIGGAFTGVNFVNKAYIARLNADGSLDNSFTTTTNSPVVALKSQADNKILVGGNMSLINNVSRMRYGRLNADGSLDTAFNVTSGADAQVWNFDVQSDGKILMAGDFTTVNGSDALGIVRLAGSNSVPLSTIYDYNGDGRADISVYRPSSSIWYQLTGSNYQFSATAFGLAEDIITPADFDGDGKTDIAIFRPSTGTWWYAASSVGGQQRATTWGQAGDIPLPSDFDGDGKADFVVYRPSSNYWFRYSSQGQNSSLPFGTAGDKPVIADFDGDGKTDLAIFRPSTRTWWYAASSAGGEQRAITWGLSDDVPVPADYDGDGKTDTAVFRPSNGVWYVLQSSNQTLLAAQFGQVGDKPIAADYDGDGKSDFAVYRPSAGVWYLLRSTEGFTAIGFGNNTDLPIPNAYIKQ